MSEKVIAVFGSAGKWIQEGTAEFEAAHGVGQALAEAGFAVMTGGYDGVMAAVSQGAHEGGGHVIGVTTTQIEKLRQTQANAWVKEERPHLRFTDRINHLIYKADGYVAMPGGVGTLAEVAQAWEWMRVQEIPVRPLVCYGKVWADALRPFVTGPYVLPEAQAMIDFVDSPEAVVAVLKERLKR